MLGRARAFVDSLGDRAPSVVAVTHHTAILALRAVLEERPVSDLAAEARGRKTPNAGILLHELRAERFHQADVFGPGC